jgi:hypothetical protein
MGENGNIIKLTKTHTNKYKGLVFNPDYPEWVINKCYNEYDKETDTVYIHYL